MFATNKNSSHPHAHADVIQYLTDNFSNRWLWAVLAFQAGWINGGGFLACHRFVTHTTGFATQFGYDIALTKWTDAAAMITLPVFFLAGSMLGAFYVDRPLHRHQKAQFHVLFFIMTFFLGAVTLLGSIGALGKFGSELDFTTNYCIIALLCMSSGIQNACSTTASKSYVRTTHLTGYTTDLGISFVRFLTLRDPERLRMEKKQNIIRLIVILSFITGTAFSSIIFLHYGYVGFLLPTYISLCLYIISRREFKKND